MIEAEIIVISLRDIPNPKNRASKVITGAPNNGIRKGAIGVNLGRNIWQDEHPVAMIRAIRAIIHEDASPEQAQELYDSVKSGKA